MHRPDRRKAMTWGAVCVAMWSSTTCLTARADEHLPQRNMLVEWRVTGRTQGQQRNAGVQSGQVIINSNGQVIGRTSIGMGTIQTEDQSDSVRQVQVLNGGRARLYVGQSQPFTNWQWAWGGTASPSAGSFGSIGAQSGAASGAQQPGGQLVPQTTWIDVGDGLSVRPRWTGGRAPVVVELEAQAKRPGQPGGAYTDPDGQTRRLEVSSTLSVPMGEWVVVARTGIQSSRQQSGSYSTRDVDSNEAQQLEIRVTAP